MKSEIIVLKLGGSVVNNKLSEVSNVKDLLEKPGDFIRYEDIDKFAYQTSQVIEYSQRGNKKFEIWCCHGTGLYGHFAVERFGVTEKVREFTNFLNREVRRSFEKYRVKVESIDPAKTVFPTKNGFNVDKLIEEGKRQISKGIIPLSYGTVVGTDDLKIFSADDFVEYVSICLHADRALMFMDVPLSTEDPKINPEAKALKKLTSLRQLKISLNPLDKSGGLLAKINKLQNVRLSGKTDCRIINAMEDENVYKSIIGKKVPAEVLAWT